MLFYFGVRQLLTVQLWAHQDRGINTQMRRINTGLVSIWRKIFTNPSEKINYSQRVLFHSWIQHFPAGICAFLLQTETTLYRPVYTCNIVCSFCRTFQWNCKCKLAAISARFVAPISQPFRTYWKHNETWRRFGGNCNKYLTRIAKRSQWNCR